MGVASRSHTAFPPADVSLELEAALPVSSQSAPPSARVLQVGGLPWGFGEPVGDMLGRATLEAILRTLLSWEHGRTSQCDRKCARKPAVQ